jgi:pilus assembly protein FimV
MVFLFATHASAAGISGSQANFVVQIASITHASSGKTEHSTNVDGKEKIKPSGKLSLTLSMTLSVPASASTQPASAPRISDVPQGAQASKEKRLSELYSQIAETEKLIQAQQRQLANFDGPRNSPTNPGAPSVAGSGMSAQSAVASIAPKVDHTQTKPKMVAAEIKPAGQGVMKQIELLEMSWVKLATGLALLLVALAFVWYRKVQTAHLGTSHHFKIPNQVHEDTESAMPSTITKKSVPLVERSMKVPAYIEQKTQSILPPEYEMLEEADIYLRFGHDKLAEEALREAIKINPRNPQAYLTLSRIYFSHGDSAAFLTLANQLKPLSDVNVWDKVAEMGRSLDPDNPLYS